VANATMQVKHSRCKDLPQYADGSSSCSVEQVSYGGFKAPVVEITMDKS